MTQKTTTGGSGRLAGALAGADQNQTPFAVLRKQMNLLRPDIAKMIGAEKVDRFIRVCLTAVQANEKLVSADRRSLFIAAMECAQDGLIPDGAEAVFNIYSTKVKKGNAEVWVDTVQYLPMAYGLVQKMYEIPGVVLVDALPVYDKEMDSFEYERGDNPHIKHVPYGGDEEPGKVMAAYVVVHFKDGSKKREVMFRRDIEKVRKKSKAPNGLMWKEGDEGFYDQGAVKSVIHRVFKQLPQAERLQRILAKDNKAVGLAGVEVQAAAEDGGVELMALVDGRLGQEIRDQPLSGASKTVDGEVVGKTVDGEAGGGAPGAEKAATPPPAKPGDPGTPELKKKFLDKISTIVDNEILDIEMEAARFFKWENNQDLLDIQTAYLKRKDELAKK